jgi:predicted permease
MAFLLLIATANAASLFAGRAEGRRREVAVRQALGASRWRLARLFFMEALLLTSAAAAAGLLFARIFLRVVISQAPIELPRTTEIGLNGLDVLFAAGVAALMAVFYGALSIRRQEHAVSGGLLQERWPAGRHSRRRGRDPFVVLQVALALGLVVGSVLMLKTYRTLSQTTLGFSADRVLTMEVSIPGRKAGQHVQLYQQLVDRIRLLPGVEDASAASFAPLTQSEHVFPTHAGASPIPFKFFTPGYFQTMKTPVVRGAGFAPGEPVRHPFPVLVSASLARRLFPDGKAIGQAIRRLEENGEPVRMAQGVVPPFTIAGIVGDVRETTLRVDPMEIVYIPVIEPEVELSIVPTNMSVMIRTSVAPLSIAPLARTAIATLDPTLSVGRVRTLEAIVRSARAREAFVGGLLLLAATVSVFLGAVGIYGSVAYVVRQRTREIGIRLALGASRTEVLRMVVGGALAAVAAGSALGLLVALAGTRTLRALLFGVDPGDPASLAAAALSLLAAGGAAAFLAARHAVRIQPVRAMRDE